mmetsp:Transcript_31534/g.64334  ORF Transcript_31534/g.64334 Transcript_31534/m.64334 type:complete len:801 (+) Transcript_31534:186-2588(+)
MGCASSTQAGTRVIYDTIPYQFRYWQTEKDDGGDDDFDDGTNCCRNSLIDEPTCRKNRFSASGKKVDGVNESAWGPICPTSCQTEANALRILPSVLVTDSPQRDARQLETFVLSEKARSTSPDQLKPNKSSVVTKLSRSRLSCNCDNTAATPLHHSHQTFTRNYGFNDDRNQNNDTEESIQAFSQRQWLVLPENRIDLNTLHPPLGPFLGNMYWTAASPLEDRLHEVVRDRTKIMAEDANESVCLGGIRTVSKENSLMDQITDTPERNMLAVPSHGITVAELQRYPSLVSPSRQYSTHNDSNNDGSIPSRRTRLGISSSPPQNLNATNYNTEPSLTSLSWSETTASSAEESDWNVGNRLRTGRNVDTSREILDYSALEESYVLHTSVDIHRQRSPQEPRRLFQSEDEQDSNDEFISNMHLVDEFPACHEEFPASNSFLSGHKDLSEDIDMKVKNSLNFSPQCVTYASQGNPPQQSRISSIHSHTSRTEPSDSTPPQFHASPSVAVFTGQFGSRRERHISTLPSQIPHQPIRLRVTETDNTACPTRNQGDFFSYDPYFSSGKYLITTLDGRPYGNGLFVKMGPQFMTLEDSANNVLAVIKSRYTHTPSHVVYSPKPRFDLQPPSGHRLTSLSDGEKCVDGNNVSSCDSSELYPWALIQKSGRTMEDEVTVHLVDGESPLSLNGRIGSGLSTNFGRNRSGSTLGIFNSKPVFRGRHEFDRELHTHTVISRVASPEDVDNDGIERTAQFKTIEEEIPCCVIVRDPSNLNAMDITIAPGIDPLLMICYLASHSKMDVEPIMGGY